MNKLKKESNKTGLIIFMVVFFAYLIISGLGETFKDGIESIETSAKQLRIIASTENKDVENVVIDNKRKNNLDVSIQ